MALDLDALTLEQREVLCAALDEYAVNTINERNALLSSAERWATTDAQGTDAMVRRAWVAEQLYRELL